MNHPTITCNSSPRDSHVCCDHLIWFRVTELVEGGELFDRIVSKESYAEADARKVILTLLRVTEHLHSLGIVHRDYKPEVICCKLVVAHDCLTEPSTQVYG